MTCANQLRRLRDTISSLRQLAAPEPNLERASDLLRRAESDTDRLGRLVDQLSDASRVALGRLEVRPAQRDLGELLHDVVERLDPVAASRIHVDLSPEGMDTRGEFDAELLERVVANLLSNAYKYSAPDTPIHIVLADEGDAIHISVRDHGIGLAPGEITSLFHRYTRARGAVEQGVEGLGLGLYLSRGIVEAHGGGIWAESAGKGQGATFHVLLPRSRMTSQQLNPPSGVSP